METTTNTAALYPNYSVVCDLFGRTTMADHGDLIHDAWIDGTALVLCDATDGSHDARLNRFYDSCDLVSVVTGVSVDVIVDRLRTVR